ncbi:MAG TPA: precorrin-6y C5,15-methyltransferase (decarboxylating) subunit CbiE, partial [Desulfobacterales bacterium]|nr:precorrin-6y C5,15-methyltransferase (decarboxylating) subunit CbiE [Desulfobacterales bacterium]
MNKIHVIGLGIELDSPRQDIIRLIHASNLLVGGARLVKRFEGYKGKVLEIKGPLGEVVKTIKKEWSQGRKVVVLADGDPLFFGIGKRLLAEMNGDQLEFIPSITTVQVTAARAKIPWDNWRVVSIHGREDIWPLVRAFTFSDMVGVYTGSDLGPSVIATVMKERNIDTFRMTVFENLGYADERIRDVSLDEVEGIKFSPLNFVLLRRVKRPAVALSVGLSDELYVHDRGMITKKEIRAIGLASLAIKPTDTVWDLGAGSGAVAIEASCLAREGKVFAVERNRERVGWIRENIKRTG